MYIKSKTVGEKIYWFCQRARSKMLPYCPAKALTLGDNISWTTGHNHGSDPVSVEVKAAEKQIWEVRSACPDFVDYIMIEHCFIPCNVNENVNICIQLLGGNHIFQSNFFGK
jgi:hypothetical protein